MEEIAGILYYKIKRYKSIRGQQLGSDGIDAHCVIFHGDKTKMYHEAQKYVDTLRKLSYIEYVDYIENNEDYYGLYITHQY